MKKLNVILLIFSFILSGIGGIFLFGASASNEGVVPTHAPIVEEITEYTYKTYEDYFIDNDIPTTKTDIAKTTITGNGSQENPYIINSSNDFYYAIKVALFSGKYIELNCDVYLNDEKFDKDGNPSGGDGIYYNWTGDTNVRNCYFDGKGHTIYGLYRKSTGAWVGLFGYIGNITYIPSISNLNMADFYIEGESGVYVLGQNVTSLTNCSLLSGHIKSNSDLTGFAKNARVVENCTNYVDFSSKGSFGLVGAILKKMTNCKNYGNIFDTNRYSSVFAGRSDNGVVIQDCINYGDIIVNDFSGGFVAQVNGTLTMLNCVNYGKLTQTYVRCGGFVGLVSGNLNLYGCKNYGQLTCVSQVYGVIDTKADRQINIIDCEFSPETWIPITALTSNSETLIENCVINAKGITTARVLCSGSGNLNITNMQANIKTNKGVMQILSDPKTYSYNIENVIFNFIGEVTNVTSYLANKNWTKINCQNLIVCGNFEGTKVFYGIDFSGFYYSWKLGKIGLVALDGRGQFQGTIDEEWLKNNGYTKKSA